jgi:hypothetical protein
MSLMIFSVNVRPNIFMEQFIHNPPHGVQHYLWDMDSSWRGDVLWRWLKISVNPKNGSSITQRHGEHREIKGLKQKNCNPFG